MNVKNYRYINHLTHKYYLYFKFIFCYIFYITFDNNVRQNFKAINKPVLVYFVYVVLLRFILQLSSHQKKTKLLTSFNY